MGDLVDLVEVIAFILGGSLFMLMFIADRLRKIHEVLRDSHASINLLAEVKEVEKKEVVPS